jgi:hypothetical protein
MIKLIKQYVELIKDQLPTPSEVTYLAENGHSSTLVHHCHPPSKRLEMVDGDNVFVSIHKPEETHFAGYEGKDAEAANATNHGINGLLRVSLLQGFRRPKDGKPDPRTLPGGMTVVDELNKWALGLVENPADAFCFRVIFRGKEKREGSSVRVNRLEVHMVWDIGTWDKWRSDTTARAVARHELSRQPPKQHKKLITLDEYMNMPRRQAERSITHNE